MIFVFVSFVRAYYLGDTDPVDYQSDNNLRVEH